MLVLLALAARAAVAQQAPPLVPSHPSVAHYAKWGALASAVAFTAFALQEHRHSNDAWNGLISACLADNQSCALGADGRYLNRSLEFAYELSVYYDHRARLRLVAAQVSFAAAVGLFVIDLPHGSGGPKNIPFHPLQIVVTPTADGARAALRLAF
jgi:hypothetical protein